MNHLCFEMDFKCSCGVEKVKDRLKKPCDAFWKLFLCIPETQFGYHVLGVVL